MLFILFALVGIILALVLLMLRTFRNVGPLTLEEKAHRDHLVFIPVNIELLPDFASWSRPVRFKIEQRDALLADIIINTDLGEPAEEKLSIPGDADVQV